MPRDMSAWLFIVSYGTLSYVSADVTSRVSNADVCSPLVIAHRGASGYVPEHTLGAYALAVTMGADYIEPDLVMTKDGHLIARHDNELGLSTDVADHTEFASRYKTQMVDGRQMTGWFTEDFTLEEIKTLRAIERIPTIRPGNARMDKSFDIPTMQEIIDLAKSMEGAYCREVGVYPELKHPTHFQLLGLAMERPIVDVLHNNGYLGPKAPAYIQSFEVNNLKELKNMTELRLVQLYGASAFQPVDQAYAGTTLTYGAMATAEGLRDVATYAYGVGPDKSYIIPRDANNNLGAVTNFVSNAHAAGLKVHPYTFRSENTYLPAEFRSNSTASDAIGDMWGELEAFIAAGVDGAFVDQPDILALRRDTCVYDRVCDSCPSSASLISSLIWLNVSILALIMVAF